MEKITKCSKILCNFVSFFPLANFKERKVFVLSLPGITHPLLLCINVSNIPHKYLVVDLWIMAARTITDWNLSADVRQWVRPRTCYSFTQTVYSISLYSECKVQTMWSVWWIQNCVMVGWGHLDDFDCRLLVKGFQCSGCKVQDTYSVL